MVAPTVRAVAGFDAMPEVRAVPMADFVTVLVVVVFFVTVVDVTPATIKMVKFI